MSRLKTLVEQPARRAAAARWACALPGLRHSDGRPHRAQHDRPSDGRRECNGLSRGRDDALPDHGMDVPWMHVAFENAAAVASGVDARRARSAPARFAGRRGCRGRRVRRRRRHLRHRPAGAVRRTRARASLPVRLLRQRGVHEHRRAALGRDTVRREHDDEPVRSRELRQGAAAEGHDGDRRRSSRSLRGAGRFDATGRT